MRFGVVGAGVMGSGIAQVAAVAGCDVVCVDRDPDALATARANLVEGRFGLRGAVERGKLASDELAGAVGRIAWLADLDALTDTDLVVEAVPEDLALKTRVFRQLDRIVGPEAILATNSSGFPVAALAAATDREPLVIGWHWASPPQVMRFAEIVTGPRTAPATLATVVGLATTFGKRPIVVRDQPQAWGYVANRIYFAAIAEARQVLDEGLATADDIDQLLVDCFRWPVGPFTMMRGATSGWP